MRSNRSKTSQVQRGPSRVRPTGPRAFTFIVGAVVALAGLFIALPGGFAGAAQAPINLGTAASFSVLAGAGISNTGPTTIAGDVGTFPTPAETGFGTITLGGANHDGDAVTQQAKTDLTTAYNTAAGSGPPIAVATELGGTTLTPGVYNSPTLGLTGTLTLNTLGDPNAVFVFQAASTLITATNSSVIVLNGAQACNVYWQVGSSATLGVTSHLIGSVLASSSITATTGATIQGRLLAQNGAVTLDSNTLTNNNCPATPTTTTTTTAPTPTTTPADKAGSDASVANYFRFLRFLQGLTTNAVKKTTGSGITTGTVSTPGLTTGNIPPTLAFTGTNPAPLYFGFGSVALGVALMGGSVLRRRKPMI
jgi:hypothetical protein